MPESDAVPIKICGCHEDKVKRTSKKNFLVPFSLSSNPSGEWRDMFEEEWHGLRKRLNANNKATAYARKNEIVLECPLPDIRTHFPLLKEAVAATNRRHDELIKDKAEKNARKRNKREAERQQERAAIHDALQGIEYS